MQYIPECNDEVPFHVSHIHKHVNAYVKLVSHMYETRRRRLKFTSLNLFDRNGHCKTNFKTSSNLLPYHKGQIIKTSYI